MNTQDRWQAILVPMEMTGYFPDKSIIKCIKSPRHGTNIGELCIGEWRKETANEPNVWWQAQQLLIIDTEAKIEVGDPILRRWYPLRNSLTDAICTHTQGLQSDSVYVWKILASYPALPNTIPLSIEFVITFCQSGEGSMVKVETYIGDTDIVESYKEGEHPIWKQDELYRENPDNTLAISLVKEGKLTTGNKGIDSILCLQTHPIYTSFEKPESNYEDTPALDNASYVKIGMNRISEILHIMCHDVLRYSTGEYPEKEWISKFINGGYCRGIVINGALKAALIAEPMLQDGIYLWIIAVNKEDIGHGNGQALLTSFEQEMTSLNKNWIHLTSGALSENFYRRNGFTTTDVKVVEMTKYLNTSSLSPTTSPVDVEQMAKELSAISDEHAIHISILAGNNYDTDELKAINGKKLINDYWNKQTNVSADSWLKIFNYLNGCGYSFGYTTNTKQYSEEDMKREVDNFLFWLRQKCVRFEFSPIEGNAGYYHNIDGEERRLCNDSDQLYTIYKNSKHIDNEK